MGGAMLRAGRWYVIEQAIRLNTAAYRMATVVEWNIGVAL
jgi:hypothetical protein